MGFLDALKDGAKKLADKVTGGYGKISFEMEKKEASSGEGLPFHIKVDATGELKAKRVVVRLRGTENCRIEIETPDENSSFPRRETKTFTNTTQELEIEVGGALEMKEGESKEYSGEFMVPGDCQPTYHGVIADHRWEIEADVDVPWGKDLKQSMEVFIR